MLWSLPSRSLVWCSVSSASPLKYRSLLSETSTEFAPLAVIRHAHGVRGEVKIASFTDPLEQLLTYALTDKNGKPYTLTRTGIQKGILLCRIEGVSDRNAAEALRGTELGVARDALPDLPEHQTYVSDLIGMEVRDEADALVGKVTDIVNYGASDIVVIDTASGELMLPYAEPFFPGEAVDGVLICRLPEIVENDEEGA